MIMIKLFKSLLITGYTGTGKTYFIEKLLKSITNDESDNSKVILLNPKSYPFLSGKNNSKVASNIKTLNQIQPFLDVVQKELLPRLSNEQKQNEPHFYIFIDEYADAIYENPELANDFFRFLFKQQKALNITFTVATQVEEFPPFLKAETDTEINLYYPVLFEKVSRSPRGGFIDFRNTLLTGNEQKINTYLNNLNEEIETDLTSFLLSLHTENFKAFMNKRTLKDSEELREHYVFIKVSDIVTNQDELKALFNLSHKLKVTFIIIKLDCEMIPNYLEDILHTHIHFNV